MSEVYVKNIDIDTISEMTADLNEIQNTVNLLIWMLLGSVFIIMALLLYITCYIKKIDTTTSNNLSYHEMEEKETIEKV